MRLIMEDYFVHLYYELQALETGLRRRFLSIHDDKSMRFSYYEKGCRIPEQPSLVFIHGFSANKESWISTMHQIAKGYHCILIDLPGHGETVGLEGEEHNVDKVADELKLLFDKLKLTEPLYIIGHSMGGTFSIMFTSKYPQYVSMLCLLSPPPSKEYESAMMQKVRSGMYGILLPETPAQFDTMTDLLTPQEVTTPKPLVHKYFKSRLRVIDEQKRILQAFLDNVYVNLEEHYEQLKDIKCPTLILWGREDQLCMVDSADYFSKLISDSEVVIFNDCGHFIAYDKPKETAKAITNFLDLRSYCIIENIE